MGPKALIFALAFLVPLLAPRFLQASPFSIGVTGAAWTKPNDGDVTFQPLTDFRGEFAVNRHFSLGVAYSWFEPSYENPYGDVDPDQSILSFFVAVKFFVTKIAASYAKIGAGLYQGKLGSDTVSRSGIYGGVGERIMISTRFSLFLEAQHHFENFDSDNDYPPTGELSRILLGMEVSI